MSVAQIFFMFLDAGVGPSLDTRDTLAHSYRFYITYIYLQFAPRTFKRTLALAQIRAAHFPNANCYVSIQNVVIF